MKHPRDLDAPLAKLVAKLPAGIKPLMWFASAIASSVSIVVIFALLISASLIFSNEWLLRATLIGVALTPVAELSKFITRRRRPETLYVQQMRIKTYSFPSGHSYISVLVFGFLAFLAAATWPYGFIVSLALAGLAFCVGLSRVYLGAHFPSDVLGGWALGYIVLIFWVKVAL